MEHSNHKSELSLLHGSNVLIVCFGGIALQFGGILPFEFLRFLLSTYREKYDYLFYIDLHQSWYHKGIYGITNTIDETKKYLEDKIKSGNYEKVIFMGVSAGGYASILFGSLCKVNEVIAFIPQTILPNPVNPLYGDLKSVIQENTQYLLYGDTSIQDITNNHYIYQCENIECFSNVTIVKQHDVDIKKMRYNGELKTIIDKAIEG
jgi:predicted esterase YcpF (UPF0227 family)